MRRAMLAKSSATGGCSENKDSDCLDLNSRHLCVSRSEANSWFQGTLIFLVCFKRRGLRLAYVAQSHAMLGRSFGCLDLDVWLGDNSDSFRLDCQPPRF